MKTTIGQRERKRRMVIANTLLPLFNDHLRMEIRNGRLWIVSEWTGYRSERAAILNESAGSLKHYRTLGMGGTSAQAVAMLVRWIRGLPRVPRATWEYWCGQTVFLARDRGSELLAALDSSGYFEPVRETGCVFCGNQRIADWWSRDGDLTGPCCSHSGCKINPPVFVSLERPQ